MNTTNEPAGIDLDKLPRYSVGVERCTMDRDDYEGEWLKRSDVQTALARRAPAPVVDERALFEATMPSVHPRDRNMPDHSYNSPYLHIAWEVWQLARAESPAPVVAHDAPEAPASAQPDRGAAHAQQEAAPAEVTKSQERDYNWLLGLAKSKGYQTVYGALYAAPTAVPYLGILPSHSEREAANVGGLRHAVEDALREENRGTSGRLILDFHAEQALRDALSQSHTIAAGQEAANAKDAARVTYTCKGKGGAYSLIGVAYGAGTSRDTTVNLYREVGTGVMYFRTPADFHDRMERINAAMAAVGAAGQEGGK